MLFKDEVVTNFDWILFSEWREKADPMVSRGVNESIKPYLEDDVMKTLSMLQAALKSILFVIPKERHGEFIEFCFNTTHVEINGTSHWLRDTGFFDEGELKAYVKRKGQRNGCYKTV